MNFALPFFHLNSEVFWHLEPFVKFRSYVNNQSSISSINKLKETIQYATLSPTLFMLLSNKNSRDLLKQALIDNLTIDSYGPLYDRCLFCNLDANCNIIAENETALAFYDNYPVTLGHTLLIPKRHVNNYFELNKDEIISINELTFTCKNILHEKYNPDGFNIGTNINKAAGQTIFHCHIHLIPRYVGDVANPTGGVRGVIPSKQSY